MDAPKAFEPKAVETTVIKKICWRILPLVLVAYCVAYVDRANIAVAALTMNKDLGFSAFTYGLGAGIFFLGYVTFEVPSNLVLERVGARRWIARIMFTWGILSAACAFIAGPKSFFVLRFLLGVAEAGFFPGVVLYFTYWFPDRYRGRIIAALFLAVPGANALSNVASGAILEMNGVLGLRGWQWVFLIEAAPAVILSVVVWRTLVDRPALAPWLNPDERQWLERELAEEHASVEARERLTLGKALMDPRVLNLSIIWVLTVTAGYGELLHAANRERSRPVEPDDRRCIGNSLSRRHDRAFDLGLVDRSDRRASMAPDQRVGDGRGRICGGRNARELVLGARRGVARARRNLRRATCVLAAALDLPERQRRGRRHRADQFDRKSRWLCRSLCRGLDQGFN
jgi:Major Facilitator Superfamily